MSETSKHESSTREDSISAESKRSFFKELEQRNPARLSSSLYIAAWTVEGFAVVTGLTISVMIAMDAFLQVTATKGTPVISDYVNIVAATLPFVLVAIVELTKIPMAGAAYSARTRGWKIVFTVTLVFLAFITFETMLNGFERNFSNLTYVVVNLQKSKTLLSEELTDLERRRSGAQALTSEDIEAAHDGRRKQLAANRDSISDQLRSQKAELLSSVQDEYTKTLREDRGSLRERRDARMTTREETLSRLNRQIEAHISARRTQRSQERNRRVDRIGELDSEIAYAIRRKREELAAAGFFASKESIAREHDNELAQYRAEKGKLEGQLLSAQDEGDRMLVSLSAKLDRTTTKLDDEITGINRRIEEMGREIAKATTLKQNDIQPSIDAYDEELLRVDADFRKQQELNSEERDGKFELLHQKEAQIVILSQEIDEKRAQLTTVRDSINKQVGTNQVYRLALRFSAADSAADLDPTTVTWVAVVWFGSLAAVVALTGILLALASYVVSPNQYGRDASARQLGGVLRSLRRLLVSWRRQKTKPRVVYVDREVPREVIKEVPVEKVRIVEVPYEVVVKEIVHVPVYTNDRELLNTEGKA